ncbi:MAG: alpha-mannosidase [Clostridiales bacterium]|nr:alpha-mannosidase [Clostridiales bacterium]
MLFMIGNAHLDPVWLWPRLEGMAEIVATFQSAIDRLEEYDEFVFTCSSASYYELIKENFPDLFEKIKKYVKEKRWNIVGGWYVQPDDNLPSGEIYARHALYSQDFYMREFGVRCETGYCVDSFGHNANMPQLLKKGGMKNFVFMRPQQHENPDIPILFNWQAPDGSEVLVFRIFGQGYTALDNPVERDVVLLEEISRKRGVNLMCFYGVGNHGGGPTKRQISQIIEMKRSGHELKFSCPDEYFEHIRKQNLDIPKYQGDLQMHAIGCYSVTGKVKALQRLAERELSCAEKYMSMASILLGTDYHGEEIKRAYKNVLFNTFHDILCGCSIKRATEESIYEYCEAISTALKIKEKAMLRIAKNIDTMVDSLLKEGKSDFITWEEQGLGVPVMVFNPYSYPRVVPVQLNRKYKKVCDHKGVEIPCQYVRGEFLNMEEGEATLFEAGLPPFGYATYWIYGEGKQKEHQKEKFAQNPQGRVLENAYLRIEFDEGSGSVTSIRDKRTNTEFLSKPSCIPLVVKDETDTWAHNIERFDVESVNMSPQSISMIEDGPIRQSIQIKYNINQSTVLQTFTLYSREDFVRVSVKVCYSEKNTLLRFSLSCSLSDTKAFYEMPFGHLQKSCSGKEQPALRWACLHGYDHRSAAGIAVCTDSKSSFCLSDDMLTFIGLRNSVFANHHGKPAPDVEYDYTDEGVSFFNYAVLPYTGDVPFEKINSAADSFAPADYLIDSYHQGGLARANSLFHCSNSQVVLTALKKSEDGEGYVLRLNELKQRECSAKLAFMGTETSLHFMPNEVKTIIFKNGKYVESDFLELNQ